MQTTIKFMHDGNLLFGVSALEFEIENSGTGTFVFQSNELIPVGFHLDDVDLYAVTPDYGRTSGIRYTLVDAWVERVSVSTGTSLISVHMGFLAKGDEIPFFGEPDFAKPTADEAVDLLAAARTVSERGDMS